jgi:TP901 family phage tail tape measure protein
MANRITNSGDGSMFIQVGMDLNSNKAWSKFREEMAKFQKDAIIRTEIEIDGDRFTKAVRQYKDAMGNLVEQTTLFSRSCGTVYDKITKIETPMEQVAKAEKKLAEEAKNAAESQNKLATETKKAKSIFADFTDTFMKMAKFNTINLIYDSITNSISEAIEITNEFNRATTELKKVSDLSGESLSEYTEQLSEYGEAVGRTMTEMTDSATIFKRTGSTDEEAAQLAQISELYKNVADSEITSAEASSFLVSQMKAFNYTAEQSIHVIDSVNSVANHFAVSTDDLQTALSKSAAAMATAGNSFEETIALVEAGTAIMQGQAGTVGNGLRTIAINIASLATESDEFVAANGKVNISLKNERGEIRSTYEILNDLAKNWNNLSTAEQNSIAVTLAGKHKYKSLVLPALNLFNCSKCLITL